MSRKPAIFILVLGLWAAPAAVGASGRSTLSEQIELKGASESHEYELNVPKEATSARLRVRAKVRSGQISWRLVDAEGEQRLTGHGTSGNVELDTGELENPIAGIWRLQVELVKARGHYRIDWRSE